jgi:type II secretory pathway component PulF
MPFSGAISAEQAALLAANVAEMSKMGLPLDGGLRALADELPRGRLARALREMADKLASGATMDEVIRLQAARMPLHVGCLLLAAAQSGRLPQVIAEFAQIERNRLELRRRVCAALAYPLFLVSLMLGIYLLLQLYVSVQFIKIYRDFFVELPFMTQLLVKLSGANAWWPVAAFLLVVALFGLLFLSRKIAWTQRLLYKIPVIGPMVRWGRLGRLAGMTALLLEQRIPLPDALRLTARAISDAYLAAGCEAAAKDVESGRPLSVALAAQRQFPPSTIPIIEWGDKTGALPEAFRYAAELFEGRTQFQLGFMETAILPVIFVVVLFFVGIFATAFFMPLIGLIQKMSY